MGDTNIEFFKPLLKLAKKLDDGPAETFKCLAVGLLDMADYAYMNKSTATNVVSALLNDVSISLCNFFSNKHNEEIDVSIAVKRGDEQSKTQRDHIRSLDDTITKLEDSINKALKIEPNCQVCKMIQKELKNPLTNAP